MKALLRLSPIFVLALALSACGDDETDLPDFATLFPDDNEVGSYVEDPDGEFNEQVGPYFSTDGGDVTDLIDGAAEYFIAAGFTNFGLEAYTNGTYDIELFIWQMKTPAGATTAMGEAAAGVQWTDVSLGDAGRFDQMTLTWFIRKGVYVIELSCKPIQGGGGTDPAAKTEGETFAAAVLAEMP